LFGHLLTNTAQIFADVRTYRRGLDFTLIVAAHSGLYMHNVAAEKVFPPKRVGGIRRGGFGRRKIIALARILARFTLEPCFGG
jgi:L-fucose isomerase-like protein